MTAAPQPGGESDGTTRPRPRPAPRPPAEPAPEPEAAAEPEAEPDRAFGTRAERREAERRGRSRRVAKIVLVAGIVVAVVASALLVVLLVRPGGASHAAKASTHAPATRRSPAPSPSLSGATLSNPDLATAYLAGAASDLAAVTSYDYRHLDDALNAGLAVTTGAYRDSYRAALTGSLGQSARANHVVQSFQLLNAGIGSMSADGSQAKVLVFGLESRSDDQTKGITQTQVVTLTATIVHSGDTYLISALDSGANAGLPPGSADLGYAAEAAREEVTNVLSYSRVAFDADYQRAIDAAVDPLQSQLLRSEAATKAALTKGKYDTSGAATAVAVERAQGDVATLLVAATGYQVARDGTRTATTDGRYEVTVVHTSGGWRTSSITPVGPS